MTSRRCSASPPHSRCGRLPRARAHRCPSPAGPRGDEPDRGSRCCSACAAVSHVPGGIQLGQGPAGLDQQRHGRSGSWCVACCRLGPLRSLLVDGVIAGTGSVLVFLPQILMLFAFILALEDSGYLPRAAFMLDRLMGRIGLSGRAFIPLLSSFACAIPGIMATRTIPVARDRLATIMLAPLMTCSARLAGLCADDRCVHSRSARWASEPARAWCCSRCTWRAWQARSAWRW